MNGDVILGLALLGSYLWVCVSHYFEVKEERKREAELEITIPAPNLMFNTQPLNPISARGFINTQMVQPLCGSVIHHPTSDVKDIETALGVSADVLRHFDVIGKGDTVTHLFGLDVKKLAECAVEIDAVRNAPTGLTAAMYGITNNN